MRAKFPPNTRAIKSSGKLSRFSGEKGNSKPIKKMIIINICVRMSEMHVNHFHYMLHLLVSVLSSRHLYTMLYWYWRLMLDKLSSASSIRTENREKMFCDKFTSDLFQLKFKWDKKSYASVRCYDTNSECPWLLIDAFGKICFHRTFLDSGFFNSEHKNKAKAT